MKQTVLLWVSLLLLITTSAQQKTSITSLNSRLTSRSVSATDAWENNAQKFIAESEYFFHDFTSIMAVANRKQKLSFEANENTLITRPLNFGDKAEKWSTSLTLLSVSKSASALCNKAISKFSKEGHLSYIFPGYRIDYINNEEGLRQNFIISEKPAGHEDLCIHLKTSGNLIPSIKNGIFNYLDPASGKVLLQYDGLKVWDKNGKILASTFESSGDGFVSISVNDKNAEYPVTVDPLTHSPEWVTSADGVLPALLTNLALQVDALYGYTMAGVGDVNGDGYDDVAIGAPAAIDVVAGPLTVVGAGAVFVYFGSATGLPVTPSRVLRASTAVTNALFGFSVSGGNVTGSTAAGLIRNDIIVGAPGERYSTATSGIPSSANVTAGKVYVFDGAQLTAGPATPLLSIFLNGSGYFSNGISGILLSNVAINALFGFSVSTTDDLNADGLSEVIVGSPGYAGVQLLDVRAGAAFVYLSSALSTNTPTRLTAPTLVGFPGLLNLDGLLFGFSVDGAGDYNKDGKPDVVVGAPAGLNLGVSGFLGGSAYVYTGNGSGINTAIQTQLSPSGPLLGSVANLFGYKVKGATGVSGQRTGNILVSAPAGNVLSNVLSGLRLKTGYVHVFSSKLTPAANENSIQALSSPRNASLLSLLSSLSLDLSVLFGSSMDNLMDANCDGIADIIVGEPLSTGVGFVGANAVSGGAYVFTGKPDGTYNTVPYWTLTNTVSFDLGINAASLIGYSVAGAGHVKGAMKSVRALVGAPGKALDFSTGVLNLGNTLGTLFSFTSGNNGLGKAYAFAFNCDVLIAPDYNVTHINVPVDGSVFTNDLVPAGTTYGLPVANPGNPAGATITMNADGTYTFNSTATGVFIYNVPVCIPNQGCTMSLLTITVVGTSATNKPPIANTDLTSTMFNTPVVINSLANDAAGNIGGQLFPSSVVVTTGPSTGTSSVNTLTGEITYTPASGFTGNDTLYYSVCDNSLPVALCASAMQVIMVKAAGAANTTLADDDFIHIAPGVTAFGNVKINDTDPEGDAQTVSAQNSTIAGKGTLVLAADGSYTFTPVAGFTGPVSFVYTTCDNGTPGACAQATLYILVSPLMNPDLTPSTRISNGSFVEANSTTRDFVLEINEILNVVTDNVSRPIQVRITKSDNFNYTFDPAETAANVPGLITVNNPDWVLITNNSTSMVFQLNVSKNITGLATSRIGLKLQVLTGAAVGTENQTVVILNGSGNEVNFNNNTIVRILNIVN